MLDEFFQKRNVDLKFNPEGRSNSQAVRGAKVRDNLFLAPGDLNKIKTPSVINRDMLSSGSRMAPSFNAIQTV
jgi:hypothetical protein